MALTKIPDNLIPWRRAPAGQGVPGPREARDPAPAKVGPDSGAEREAHPGVHDGGQIGADLGTQVGGQAGADDGGQLGFRIVRHDGAWVDVAVGEPEPVDADAHAAAFVDWLQGTELAGDWVARTLLERI